MHSFIYRYNRTYSESVLTTPNCAPPQLPPPQPPSRLLLLFINYLLYTYHIIASQQNQLTWLTSGVAGCDDGWPCRARASPWSCWARRW
jgi:hypothetical protein